MGRCRWQELVLRCIRQNLDAAGKVCRDEDGQLLYVEDSPVTHWITDDGTTYREFPTALETMYLEHGAKPEAALPGMMEWICAGPNMCQNGRKNFCARRIRSRRSIHTGQRAACIRIEVTKEQDPLSDHLTVSSISLSSSFRRSIAYACTYLTLENHRRFDYLPAESSYVLGGNGSATGVLSAGKQFWLQ